MTSSLPDNLAGDFVLDSANTKFGFVARHAMVTRVHGVFERFSGHAHLDLTDPTRSRVFVDIEAASVYTGVKQRDAHLRTSDFFDVPHHPLITYRARSVSRVGPSTLTVTGELTLRGITNPLTLDFDYRGATTDVRGEERLSFTASAVISRRAWGVTWSGAVEAGGIVVADKVTLEIDVCARRVPRLEVADRPDGIEISDLAS